MSRTTGFLLAITVVLVLAGFISLNLYLFTLLDRSITPADDVTFHGKHLTYQCDLVRKAPGGVRVIE